jgi:hypothetical protein
MAFTGIMLLAARTKPLIKDSLNKMNDADAMRCRAGVLSRSAKRTGLHKDLSPLIEKRNHIMHGMWGFVCEDSRILGAGAYYSKVPDRPLLASELPALIHAASQQTHRIVTIASHLSSASPILPR